MIITIVKAGVLIVLLVVVAVFRVRDLRSAVMLVMAALASGLWLFGRSGQGAQEGQRRALRLRIAEDYLWLLFAVLALALLITG